MLVQHRVPTRFSSVRLLCFVMFPNPFIVLPQLKSARRKRDLVSGWGVGDEALLILWLGILGFKSDWSEKKSCNFYCVMIQEGWLFLLGWSNNCWDSVCIQMYIHIIKLLIYPGSDNLNLRFCLTLQLMFFWCSFTATLLLYSSSFIPC